MIHKNAAAEGVGTAVVLRRDREQRKTCSGSTENGDDTTSLTDVDALLSRLMGSQNVAEAVLVQEVRNGRVTEANGTRATLTLTETGVVQVLLLVGLSGISPQQVIGELFQLDVKAAEGGIPPWSRGGCRRDGWRQAQEWC